VLSDARVLASELVTDSSGLPETASLRLAVEVRDDALRVDVRHPGGSRPGARSPLGSGLGLQLVEALAARWGSTTSAGPICGSKSTRREPSLSDASCAPAACDLRCEAHEAPAPDDEQRASGDELQRCARSPACDRQRGGDAVVVRIEEWID
jgi:hypothetical protein